MSKTSPKIKNSWITDIYDVRSEQSCYLFNFLKVFVNTKPNIIDFKLMNAIDIDLDLGASMADNINI